MGLIISVFEIYMLLPIKWNESNFICINLSHTANVVPIIISIY
jgi:hypothetical protein